MKRGCVMDFDTSSFLICHFSFVISHLKQMKDEFIPYTSRINSSQLRMFLLIFVQSLDSRIVFIFQ